MHFAVNEGYIHIVIDIDRGFRDGVSGLLSESRNEGVKAFPIHFPEHDIQAAGIVEHIVCVTEHYILRRGIVEAGVPCAAHAPVRFIVDFHRKGEVGKPKREAQAGCSCRHCR